MTKLSTAFLTIIAAAAVTFTSCASTPETLSMDVTAGEIIQMAQTAFDSGNVELARNYYQLLVVRYSMEDVSYEVEGKYEIAHTYIKQKNYSKAEPILEEVISICQSYSDVSNASYGKLSAYLKLAENDLAKCKNSKDSK